ncbi:glutathione S-transferase [Polymorphobacter glacialis]|uniref:Glutathione S-transferase n=1 Tax=Sandarakinorhabdus glacialis TaxID=1614636 RepID=A0A917E8W9_9SPHN|nr:glutathione S-transferase family protein [Polymorphobacter glacialis]GGE12247.1 glutathione S-transferase [Polymorphobacter glacialis]
MTELVFYTHPLTYGRIARWMLEEVGARYRTEVVDIEARRTSAFLALNPIGKMPVLVHGNAVVSECAAICAYLGDAFPLAGLAPASGTAARGDYYRWLFFAAGPLETATTLSSMEFAAPPLADQRAGWGSLDRVVDMLDTVLSQRDWLAGGRFSAADLYLGALLDWAIRFGTIAERPVFGRYLARMDDRPARQRAEALDDELAGRAIMTPAR